MNNNNNNNRPDCTVHVPLMIYKNLSQNRWTIPQAIAVMRLYNFNRELQQTIINIAARRVTQIERLMRWMDLSEYRLVAPNNQLITYDRCSNWWEFDAPNNHETLSLLDYGFVMYAMESVVESITTRSQNSESYVLTVDRPERQSIILPRREGLNGLQAPQASSNWEINIDAPSNQSITRYWSDGFLRTFVRQRDNSNWEMNISLGEMNLVWDGCNENHMQEIRNALRTQQMGNPNEAPY